MAEPVTNEIDIQAPVARVIDVISDLENTDRWANEAQSSESLATDDAGRPTRMKVTFGALGFSTTATYDVAYTDTSVTLSLVEAALIRSSTIVYTATATDTGGGTTHVHLSSSMEVTVPVPQWGLTRAMRRSAAKNLESVRADAEAGSRAA